MYRLHIMRPAHELQEQKNDQIQQTLGTPSMMPLTFYFNSSVTKYTLKCINSFSRNHLFITVEANIYDPFDVPRGSTINQHQEKNDCCSCIGCFANTSNSAAFQPAFSFIYFRHALQKNLVYCTLFLQCQETKQSVFVEHFVLTVMMWEQRDACLLLNLQFVFRASNQGVFVPGVFGIK